MNLRWRVSPFLLLALAPSMYLLILEPSSFLMGWNQGLGGLLLTSAFVTFEYFDNPRGEVRKERGLHLKPLVLLSISLAYFTLRGLPSMRGSLLAVAMTVSAAPHSWVLLWDYLAYALYLVLLSLIFGGLDLLKRMPSGPIYLSGMAAILTLDAYFSYSTLGILQAPVYGILAVVSALLSSLGTPTYVSGNVLTLQGKRGYFSLAVYWPSAGVHSIIIYSLIMLIFLLRSGIRRRRVLYFALGVSGTTAVNLLRIFLLAAYASYVSTDRAMFEGFHAIAGELLFIPWLALYLGLIIWRLGGRRRGQ